MSRHPLGRLLGFSFALFPLVACGADNDILRTDLPNPNAAAPAPQNNTGPTDENEDLSNADQLTSSDTSDTGGSAGACEASACPTPPSTTACCTTADDMTAIRAVAAGQCGVELAGFPGCIQRDQPGVLDAACPPVEFPPGAPPMPGCCTAAGQCGAMETFLGFGCTSNPNPSTWVACGN